MKKRINFTLLSLLLIFVIFHNKLRAQVVIDIGTSFSFEKNTFFDNEESNRIINPFFLLGISYQKEKALHSFQLKFLSKSIDFSSIRKRSYYASSGDFYRSETKFLETKMRFSYLGFKYSLSLVALNKKHFSLYVGPFVELDLLVFEDEYFHKDSTIFYSRFNGVSFNEATEELSYYTTTGTSIELNNNEFDMVNLSKMYFGLGINVKTRFKYKQIFIGVGISFGLNNTNRAYYNESETFIMSSSNNEKEYLLTNVDRTFFLVDLNIGYSF